MDVRFNLEEFRLICWEIYSREKTKLQINELATKIFMKEFSSIRQGKKQNNSIEK